MERGGGNPAPRLRYNSGWETPGGAPTPPHPRAAIVRIGTVLASKQGGEAEVDEATVDNALARLEFDAQGLVPAVIQDAATKQVLMLGFMTRQMLAKTLETGRVWFWSRSRREPWLKGATSGNYLNVAGVYRNCEDNSLLILARPEGPTCHTGNVTCYYRALDEE